ncbi:hypothetical protein L9F63_027162 [Diploptera punctata]|uniref:Uncharacterized protein n=1 Tax=Diploptera punctata TaxID=6984 RepID=A0AAD8AE29_DIPPU|nr:hypothetical protein L9F63_027162 [Diploptera punctata]
MKKKKKKEEDVLVMLQKSQGLLWQFQLVKLLQPAYPEPPVPDRELAHDELNSDLREEDKAHKLTLSEHMIGDRSDAFKFQLEQYKLAAARMQECVNVMSDIEREMNRPVGTRHSYEMTLKIQECEDMLLSASDKDQQIVEEDLAADSNNIAKQLKSMKQQLQSLRRAVDKQHEQHEKAVEKYKKLGAELKTVLDWLNANETIVSRPLLERDPASVEKEIEKHKELAAKVNNYLDRVRAVQELVRHEERMPASLIEQLSEANSLPQELEERGKYLEMNKQLRLEYAAMKETFFVWVKEADTLLQIGKFGVNWLIFFSSEASIRKLVSQQFSKQLIESGRL